MLKWARENGCPWDEFTCSNAAKNGHFEILKWARENGGYFNSRVCSGAILTDILKYLNGHENINILGINVTV